MEHACIKKVARKFMFGSLGVEGSLSLQGLYKPKQKSAADKVIIRLHNNIFWLSWAVCKTLHITDKLKVLSKAINYASIPQGLGFETGRSSWVKISLSQNMQISHSKLVSLFRVHWNFLVSLYFSFLFELFPSSSTLWIVLQIILIHGVFFLCVLAKVFTTNLTIIKTSWGWAVPSSWTT